LLILDATCGRRGIWFDKENNEAVYLDIRRVVKPDILADDKNLPFIDKIFDVIVFDPPHVSLGPKSIMASLYGRFSLQQIRELISLGAREFHRVLKDDGVLLFKWNTHDMSLEKVLHLMGAYFVPLFGQRVSYRTKHSSQTFWVCLRKRDRIAQATLEQSLNKKSHS